MPNYYGKCIITEFYSITHSYILHVLINFAGTTGYLKSADPNIWYGASSHLCDESPPWYSPEFYLECAESIQDEFGIDLNRDIYISNYRRIGMLCEVKFMRFPSLKYYAIFIYAIVP